MPDLNEQLRQAVRNGDAQEIARWLDAGADIDAPGAGGMTGLMYAAEHGRTDKMRLLIGMGARLDAVDATGWTALMHAAHFGHEGAVRLLAAIRRATWPPKWGTGASCGCWIRWQKCVPLEKVQRKNKKPRLVRGFLCTCALWTVQPPRRIISKNSALVLVSFMLLSRRSIASISSML